jgi:DNA-binding transcriptional regulator YbjK
MVDNYSGDIKAAMEDIVNISYSQGELKSQLFARYLQAKHQHLLIKIAKEHKAKSREGRIYKCMEQDFSA